MISMSSKTTKSFSSSWSSTSMVRFPFDWSERLLSGIRISSELNREAALWLVLSLMLLFQDGGFVAYLTFVHVLWRCCCYTLSDNTKKGTISTTEKQNEKLVPSYFHRSASGSCSARAGDPDGIFMSIVLLPVLFQSMQQRTASLRLEPSLAKGEFNYLSSSTRWGLYASCTCVGLFLLGPSGFGYKMTFATANGAMVLFLMMLVAISCTNVQGQPQRQVALKMNMIHQVIILGVNWMMLYTALVRAKTLHGVMTHGEWTVTSALLAVALTEFLATTNWDDRNSLYQCVAMSGTVGCSLAFATVDKVVASSSSWTPTLQIAVRLAYFCSIALGTVETALWLQTSADATATYAFPRCGTWLVAFLFETEVSPWATPGWPSVPRIAWLGYWGLVCATALPCSPTNASAVITRKWFHLVALLLFVPVTLAAPQLQSLSYAIALCLLMVLECTRRQLPVLNRFYHAYLDSSKGENMSSGSMVISHMALIAGCAMPLWIQQWFDRDLHDRYSSLLLALWGVLVLGVGDAMGAVIGKNFGRLSWGQRRTVEGSLAMLMSMALVCVSLLGWPSNGQLAIQWVAALSIATLLEAFTFQLDNLVLPLAGAAVLVLLEPKSS